MSRAWMMGRSCSFWAVAVVSLQRVLAPAEEVPAQELEQLVLEEPEGVLVEAAGEVQVEQQQAPRPP